MTWAGRIGLLIAAAARLLVTYRICLGLQQHDREVLAHGVETGIIRRLPDGRVHRGAPAARPGRRRTATARWTTPAAPVPKKMNQLGALGPAIRGFFYPIEKPAEAPVSPGHPPVEPRPEREEIGSGESRR